MNPEITKPIVLEGSRVRLEPLTLDHWPLLLELASLEDYPFTILPKTEAGMRGYIQAALDMQARGNALPFATMDKAVGRVVGSTRLANFEYWAWPEGSALARPGLPDAVEIGWTWLAPQAQRSGINTEAKLLQLNQAFEVWQVKRLTLKTDARNLRSRKAIERIGGKLDGILRSHLPASDGGVRDSAWFSILDSEWPTVKARLQGFLARP
jgi:RimJ/RimL family protein N-acetyltransferase